MCVTSATSFRWLNFHTLISTLLPWFDLKSLGTLPHMDPADHLRASEHIPDDLLGPQSGTFIKLVPSGPPTAEIDFYDMKKLDFDLAI